MTERESQRQLMARKRAAGRDVSVRVCSDPVRRAELESDTPGWLCFFLPHLFFNPFSPAQLEWIAEIEQRATFGGDKALAAPRGEGKTMIALGVTLKLLLTGELRFPLLCAATGPAAAQLLGNVKFEIEFNDQIAEWYPEVVDCVRALEGATQRQRMQTVDGERTHLVWERDIVVFPTLPDKYRSRCRGSVLMTRGLDAAIRGINYRGKRPDFVLVDDPETRESAKSASQCEERERTIERDLAGLAGPGARYGRLMLCTLQNRTPCIAAKYTDPTQKPSWNGKRYRMLVTLPKRQELWEEYLHLIWIGGETGKDPEGNEANEFYRLNRAEMDEGAEVGNEHRFIADKELSALQHCYNIIARVGLANFLTECNNDPPIEEGPQESTINETLVASRTNEFEQGRVPDDCQSLVAAIDVGKHRCYWEVQAWRAGATGFIVDYGWADVMGTSIEDDDKVAIEAAVMRTLFVIRDRWISEPYIKADGEIVPIDLCPVDSGDGKMQQAVYEFVRRSGKPFVASKGFGDGRGSSPFHLGKQTNERRIGNQWFQALQPEAKLWLYGFNADHWKHYVHERFQTETYDDEGRYRAGAISLFKPVDRFQHAKFSRSIVSEKWREEFEKGKGWKRQWVKVSKENHWFDTTVMCAAAADMRGIRLIAESKPRPQPISLDELAKRSRRSA